MSSKEYFKEVANKWDSMRQNFFAESVRERAYAIAEVEKGKVASDIGAGTGFVTEGLIKKGVKVIAIDSSEEMLVQMKQKFKDYDCVEYRQGEAETLPIESNMVDYAMANMYLHHVENPFTAIKEMVRILKPGGKIVITDLDEHNFEFLRTEHFDRWMGFKRSDIEQWFIDLGLKHVIVDCAGGNCNTTSSCSSEDVSIGIFIAYGEK